MNWSINIERKVGLYSDFKTFIFRPDSHKTPRSERILIHNPGFKEKLIYKCTTITVACRENDPGMPGTLDITPYWLSP